MEIEIGAPDGVDAQSCSGGLFKQNTADVGACGNSNVEIVHKHIQTSLSMATGSAEGVSIYGKSGFRQNS